MSIKCRCLSFVVLFWGFPEAATAVHRLIWRCDRPCEARMHSVLILSPSPIGFDWPQHLHSSPYSTANKSLSSDTIQEKVCSRSSAQTLSVSGPDLFRSSPFQLLDVWHERIAVPVAQTVMKTDVLCCIKALDNNQTALPLCFWHFIHRCLLSPRRNASTRLFTQDTRAHTSWPFVM